jgi:lysyl-tRNA synthetase class 2
MERVFEIAKVFRNEGISKKHNPEFTMIECYQAYGDYNSMMDLTESIFTAAIQAVDGQFVRFLNGRLIDFTPPWSRRTYADLFLEHVNCDINDSAKVISKAQSKGFETEGVDHDVLVSNLFEECVEDILEGPVFVTDYPASLCPLTKRKSSDQNVAERFELFVQGVELANAYTELNDPILQESLFRNQLSGQKSEDSMAKMDMEFIEALKHAMPPSGGLGIGIDRMVMVLLDKPSIRDVILFPLLRPLIE